MVWPANGDRVPVRTQTVRIEDTMAQKEQKAQKNVKKAPAKDIKEKRAEKLSKEDKKKKYD